MKAFLRGKLIALSASKMKLEKAHISSWTTHLKALDQKEANSPKRSRWQEIIKLRGKINQMETRRTIQRINQRRSRFFEKINKIDKPLAKLTRGHRESILINKIRNKKGDITTKYIFCLFFVFQDRVSLYSPGCPGTHFVDHAGLELRHPPASASPSGRIKGVHHHHLAVFYFILGLFCYFVYVSVLFSCTSVNHTCAQCPRRW